MNSVQLNSIARRELLMGAAVMLALTVAEALGVRHGLAAERITIAVFGAGNRGRHSLSAMRPLPDHQVVAVAEARRDRGLSACQMWPEAK